MKDDNTPRILQFFQYAHLPPHLEGISAPFSSLAWRMIGVTEPSAEQSTGLRKLLEAKDCFVRAAVKPSDQAGSDENRYMFVDSGVEAQFYIPTDRLGCWEKLSSGQQGVDWDSLPEWVGIVDVNDYEGFTFAKPRIG